MQKAGYCCFLPASINYVGCFFSGQDQGLVQTSVNNICKSPLFFFKIKIKVISQLIEFLMSFFFLPG